MLDYDRVQKLGDYLSLFRGTAGRGRKSGGSKKAGKKVGKIRKVVVKKSGGSKKSKTIKAKKGGQRSIRRTQRKVSPSRSKRS